MLAKRATCSRLSVGAVLTKEGRVITTGYNGPPSEEKHCEDLGCNIKEVCSNAVHAEQNMIAFSAKEGISLKGTTLYITYCPCLNCANLIISAGISRVVFIHKFRSEEGFNRLLKHPKVSVSQLPIDNLNWALKEWGISIK